MKLKSVRKIISETKYNIIVFNEDGNYDHDFTVDYLERDFDKLARSMKRAAQLEKLPHTVNHVRWNTASEIMEITITLK